jgi:hypothetical protein
MSTFDPRQDDERPRLPKMTRVLHFWIILVFSLCLISVLPDAILAVIGCWQIGGWARWVYEWIISREEKRL